MSSLILLSSFNTSCCSRSGTLKESIAPSEVIFHHLPITSTYAHPLMNCFHIPPKIKAMTFRNLADLFYHQLTKSLFRVIAMPGKILGQSAIILYPLHHLIYYIVNRIVAAQSVIQTLCQSLTTYAVIFSYSVDKTLPIGAQVQKSIRKIIKRLWKALNFSIG